MVKIYIADISNLTDPKEHPELLNGLGEKRKEKTLRYRQEQKRKQSLGVGILLKQCLDQYGINIEEIRYGENGKPQIDGLYFNLSHSHDMAVCVISDGMVGCDIEKIGKLREGIAERFFTENEIKHLEQFEGELKRDEFFRLWTLKESYMKMTGEGMSLALDRFEFKFSDNIKLYRDGKLCDCNIMEYEVPGYKLSVCAEENEFDTIKWVSI